MRYISLSTGASCDSRRVAESGYENSAQRLFVYQETKPDILVCNAAGEAPIGSLEKVEATVFDEAMISNVRNNLLLANLVASDMIARRDGSIIIMSSIVGSRGRSGVGIYATTKAAVNQLVRTMAVEWGPFQVRTNAIAPTAVRTDFSRVLWDTPDALARATARVPMGRIGEADDVAGPALLLASPQGHSLTVKSSGWMAGPAHGRR